MVRVHHQQSVKRATRHSARTQTRVLADDSSKSALSTFARIGTSVKGKHCRAGSIKNLAGDIALPGQGVALIDFFNNAKRSFVFQEIRQIQDQTDKRRRGNNWPALNYNIFLQIRGQSGNKVP